MTSLGGEAGAQGRPPRIALLHGVLPLRPREALRDAFAGVTLASMNIPQVLGYTRIAGTPVVTGLYTVLLPLVAFAVFGSSRHLVVAADSATAAIFSGALSHMAQPGSDRYMALVGMLTLETAGVLLLARIFKAGFLADFLSRTVLVGFLTGVGVQVGAGQRTTVACLAAPLYCDSKMTAESNCLCRKREFDANGRPIGRRQAANAVQHSRRRASD